MSLIEEVQNSTAYKREQMLRKMKRDVEEYILDEDDEHPALYVGTYHKYNCGELFGAWLDLTKFYDYEEFIEVCHKLHADEPDVELMFQDYMYFPDQWYSEGSLSEEVFNKIQDFAELDENEQDAFNTYLDYINGNGDYQDFRNAYAGEARSEEEWAEHIIRECHPEVYESPWERFFDYKAYAEELFLQEYTLENGYVFCRF